MSDPRAAALRWAADRLTRAGISWWLTDGTALGAYRDHAFLPSDADVDLGIWPHHLAAADHALTGCRRISKPWQLQVYRHGVLVDLHVHQRDGDHVSYRLGRRGQVTYRLPAWQSLTAVSIAGIPATMPAPPEAYLTAHYGPDWRTPRSSWRWKADPPCASRH